MTMTDDSNEPKIYNSAGRRLPTTCFKPGISGNVSGRPPGIPNAFSKAFLKSISAKSKLHGDDVLEEVRRNEPGLFLRICANLIPKEILVVSHSTTPAAQLSQAELEAIVVEDVSRLEQIKMALLPLVDRVAELDQQLAGQFNRVLADG
jgi:hypothetical protein